MLLDIALFIAVAALLAVLLYMLLFRGKAGILAAPNSSAKDQKSKCCSGKGKPHPCGGKCKCQKQADPSGKEDEESLNYPMMIGMSDPSYLTKTENIQALAKRFQKNLKGGVGINLMVFAETGTDVAKYCDSPFGRRMSLEYPEDFKAFQEIMLSIDGIEEVARMGDNWPMSDKEKSARDQELAEREIRNHARSEEAQAKRQSELETFQREEQSMQDLDQENYGPPNKVDLSWSEVRAILAEAFQGSTFVQVLAVHHDNLAGGFVSRKRKVGSAKNGSVAIEAVNTMVNGDPEMKPFLAGNWQFDLDQIAANTRVLTADIRPSAEAPNFLSFGLGNGSPMGPQVFLTFFFRKKPLHLTVEEVQS